MTGVEVYLDLGEIILICWEKRKSDKLVEAIQRGIEAKDIFPAVKVHKINSTLYQLVYGNDGGHTRAFGHYIANHPLRCKIISEGGFQEYKDAFGFEVTTLFLSDIQIIPDEGQYRIKKRVYPKYR